MSGAVVDFDIAKRERLRAAFNEARKGRESTPPGTDSEVFKFEGHVFLVSYAYYLLQYLDEVPELKHPA